MLKSIKITNFYKDNILFNNINNILFFFYNFKITPYNTNKFLQKFKKYYIYTFNLYFLHFLWRGKAFRIKFYKKYRKFNFNFGHSHIIKFLYSNSFYFSKLKKQLYLIFFYSRYSFNPLYQIFNNIRRYNKYTKRGIRVKQYPYSSRFGKVSQANSILHSF